MKILVLQYQQERVLLDSLWSTAHSAQRTAHICKQDEVILEPEHAAENGASRGRGVLRLFGSQKNKKADATLK